MLLKTEKNFRHLYHSTRRRLLSARLSLPKLLYKLPEINLETIVGNEVDFKLPIMDDICLPPYHGPKDHNDFIPLMSIVKWLQPNVVVELGTAHGNTVANICNQCAHTKVYTVNAPVEKQTGEAITYKLTRDEIGRVYRNHGFANRVTQVFENTLHLDLSKHFNGKDVDLAIIDACHDTEYVVNDFYKVLPYIKPHGMVLFHDTHPSMKEHLAGSYVACMKLRRRGYDIHHIPNSWWAIWINS